MHLPLKSFVKQNKLDEKKAAAQNVTNRSEGVYSLYKKRSLIWLFELLEWFFIKLKHFKLPQMFVD